jgi:hypothetical protein
MVAVPTIGHDPASCAAIEFTESLLFGAPPPVRASPEAFRLRAMAGVAFTKA